LPVEEVQGELSTYTAIGEAVEEFNKIFVDLGRVKKRVMALTS